MTTLEAQSVPPTLGDLMYEHRVQWAAAVLGDAAVDLGAADDPIAALDGAGAAVWLDGYVPAAREDLIRAAERGARLVIAVPAGTSEGEDLVHVLPAATVIPQAVASGSLIGDAETATVQVSEPASRENATWLLVCANVDVGDASALVGPSVGGRVATQLARLGDAVAALQEANVRLARDKLGRHDAAAGSVIGRSEREATQWRERFEFEQQLAMRHHDWFKAAEARLDQPQYRAADRLLGIVRRIPGLRLIVKLLRRR
jgi:hypothetical protein